MLETPLQLVLGFRPAPVLADVDERHRKVRIGERGVQRQCPGCRRTRGFPRFAKRERSVFPELQAVECQRPVRRPEAPINRNGLLEQLACCRQGAAVDLVLELDCGEVEGARG